MSVSAYGQSVDDGRSARYHVANSDYLRNREDRLRAEEYQREEAAKAAKVAAAEAEVAKPTQAFLDAASKINEMLNAALNAANATPPAILKAVKSFAAAKFMRYGNINDRSSSLMTLAHGERGSKEERDVLKSIEVLMGEVYYALQKLNKVAVKTALTKLEGSPDKDTLTLGTEGLGWQAEEERKARVAALAARDARRGAPPPSKRVALDAAAAAANAAAAQAEAEAGAADAKANTLSTWSKEAGEELAQAEEKQTVSVIKNGWKLISDDEGDIYFTQNDAPPVWQATAGILSEAAISNGFKPGGVLEKGWRAKADANGDIKYTKGTEVRDKPPYVGQPASAGRRRRIGGDVPKPSAPRPSAAAPAAGGRRRKTRRTLRRAPRKSTRGRRR